MNPTVPSANISDLISASNGAHPTATTPTSSNPIGDFISMLSKYAQQYPTPASYIVPKVGEAVGNAIEGPVSPLPDTFGQTAKNAAGETVKAIANKIPAIGTSMIRSSPPAQLYEQAKGAIDPSQQKAITQQRQGDMYNDLQGIGLATNPVGNAVGGVVNTGINAVKNAVNKKPLLDNAGQSFSEGVMQAAPLGPLSELNPIGKAVTAEKYVGNFSQYSVPIRAAAAAARSGIEGAFLGSIAPGEGKDRLSQIKDYATFGAISAALGQAGGDLTNLGISKLADALGQTKEDIMSYISHANVPVVTTEVNPTTGERVVKPAWQVFNSTMQTPEFSSLDTTSGEPPLGMGSYIRDANGNLTPKTGSTSPEGAPSNGLAVEPSPAGVPPVENKTPVQTVDPSVEVPNQNRAQGRTYAAESDITNKNNIAENTKRNLQYSENGISTPNEKAQVNATLNGYGIKGSFDNQLQGIENQKGILSDAAQKQVMQDGGSSTKSELLKNVVHDVSYNGSKHSIPLGDVPKETSSYINNVYVRATGGDPTQMYGDIMPDSVPDTVVQKMKSIMGQDASNTFSKDPSTWTKNEQIARYARNSFDKVLDTNHPEASVINNDMSDLYKAQESIMKGANKENTAAASIPKPAGIFDKAGKIGMLMGGGGLLATGLSQPAIQTGLGAVGYGISKALSPVSNALNSQNNKINSSNDLNQPDNHKGSISNYLNNVKTDTQGHIALPEPAAPVTPLTPGTPDYVRASNALPNDTRNFMSKAKPTIIPAANKLIDDLNTMPLDVWHGLDNTQKVNSYMSDPKNPYAKQVSDLNAFNSMYQSSYQWVTGAKPDDTQLISPGLAPEQLKQRFANMVQFINDSYSQFYTPYAQTSSVPTGTNGGVTQYNRRAPSDPSGFGGGSLPSLSGLPPIGSLPTQ